MQTFSIVFLAIIISHIAYASSAATKKSRYDILLTNASKSLEPSESRILTKGSIFVITCQLDDSVVASSNIVWMHNDAQSSTFNNIKTKQSPRKLRIVINSFSSANVGIYSCKTSDGKVRGNRRVRLLEQCPNAFAGYCHNGGECVWDGTGVASCFCAKGFSGKRCEKIISLLPVKTDRGNFTPLTIFLILLSIVLLIGVLMGLAAIRYRMKRTHDMKSRYAYATNTVKVATICPDYATKIQKKPLILDEKASSAEDSTNSKEDPEFDEALHVFSPDDNAEKKRPKRLHRSDAIEEI